MVQICHQSFSNTSILSCCHFNTCGSLVVLEELRGSKTTVCFWNPPFLQRMNMSSKSLARHPAIWVLLGCFHKAFHSVVWVESSSVSSRGSYLLILKLVPSKSREDLQCWQGFFSVLLMLITVVSHYAALIAEEYLGASSKTNQI